MSLASFDKDKYIQQQEILSNLWQQHDKKDPGHAALFWFNNSKRNQKENQRNYR